MCAKAETATLSHLQAKGTVVPWRLGGLQVPDLCPGGTRGTPSEFLLPLQVKSKETSSDQWKGSETYSPNTAYGKPPAKPPVSATVLQSGTPTSVPT